MKTKTVNLTGKKVNKKSLVVKAKKQNGIKTEAIKKQNEEVLKKKTVEKVEEVKVEVAKETVKPDKKYDLTVGIKDLFEAGCHLGHRVSKTHPRVRDFIYAAKDGIEVVDLPQTMSQLEMACNFIYNAKRNGKQIVMLGTKRQAREVVKRIAIAAGVPYITGRWLGGTISNWDQIRKTIKNYNEIKDGLENNKFTTATKRAIGEMKKEQVRMERAVGGIATLDKLFDILFVVDAGFEKTAIKEARLLKIKTVAIVDTDSDPRVVDFPIVANDDNVKSVTLLVEEVGKAIKAAGVK